MISFTEYMEQGADICPECGSTDIGQNDVDIYNITSGGRFCVCHECEAEWDENFELVSISMNDEEISSGDIFTQYLENQNCPSCGHEQTNTGVQDEQGNSVFFDCNCPECKIEWTENFQLISID